MLLTVAEGALEQTGTGVGVAGGLKEKLLVL